MSDHPADYASIKNIDIDHIIVGALRGMTCELEKQTTAELLVFTLSRLARLDDDCEILFDLFCDEFADQMTQLMALRGMAARRGSEVDRRRIQAEQSRARDQIGGLVFDLFARRIDKEIERVIDERQIGQEDAA